MGMTMASTIECIYPDWTAPSEVKACCTTRVGGVSRGDWASLNLADHVEDDPADVACNRQRLQRFLQLPSEPQWLRQVHGTAVKRRGAMLECADACFEDRRGAVCVVLTADCLPVLLCNTSGTRVAAVHAGWRGLLAGVLEQAVAAFGEDPAQLLAWMGPAIGPDVFEVGDEVHVAFVDEDPASEAHFVAHGAGHWLADLYGLASFRLHRCGIERVSGGGFCTFSMPQRFFSYRRDGITGRMASLIWLQP